MCSYSKLSNIFHLLSSNLNFYWETKHSKYCCMNTLISIKLWNSNIVLNLFNQRDIVLMDNSKDHIAISDILCNHSKSQKIHHCRNICLVILFRKFFIDSIRTLHSSSYNKILDSLFFKHLSQHFNTSFCKLISFTKIFL